MHAPEKRWVSFLLQFAFKQCFPHKVCCTGVKSNWKHLHLYQAEWLRGSCPSHVWLPMDPLSKDPALCIRTGWLHWARYVSAYLLYLCNFTGFMSSWIKSMVCFSNSNLYAPTNYTIRLLNILLKTYSNFLLHTTNTTFFGGQRNTVCNKFSKYVKTGKTRTSNSILR